MSPDPVSLLAVDFEGHQGYLSLLRVNRTQAIQVVAVGLVLAIGVNLIAVYLGDHLGRGLTLLVGLLLTLGALLAIAGPVFRPRKRVRKFEGFLVYGEAENELLDQDFEYELGYSIKRYMDSAFSESQSMKMIWDQNPISARFEPDAVSAGDAKRSFDLVRQAAEYFVLEQLSTRVSDHFRSGDFDSDELVSLSHTDIPDVLLQNRFLRLFSEPMEDRLAFAGERPGRDDDWQVVMATAADGALYRRFELVLPEGWRVGRSGDQIEFDAKRFTLRIKADCQGFGENLPLPYIPEYLGLGSSEGGIGYDTFGVTVEIEIAPRRAWLVGPRGWKYYRWIDDWVADLRPQIDKDAYLDRIGFTTAATTLQMVRTWRRQTRERRSEST